ncbi:MAG: glycosyltransferase [Synergistaceae bacterium]|nr:glycosyltransferase [Synergistaceae bacterium]
MNILHIVPEFDEGGVERYVVQLCHEQIQRGHTITLATKGGHLEKYLPESVRVLHLPVHRKNLFTGLYSAHVLAKLPAFTVIHAHSRVPAWVAWRLSALTRTPWLMTAHAPYSRNIGLLPLRHADGVICVSESVQHELSGYLPANSITIPNGVRKPKTFWQGKYFPENTRLLYVGYLSRRKGLNIALEALGNLKAYSWTLDVLGDGSQRGEFESLAENLGLSERVKFWGFRDDAEEFMSRAACLLFPSFQEGLPLTVNEALAVGLPVLASDIEPLRPLASGELVRPGDVGAWTSAIRGVLEGKNASLLRADRLTSFEETAQKTEDFYRKILEA